MSNPTNGVGPYGSPMSGASDPASGQFPAGTTFFNTTLNQLKVAGASGYQSASDFGTAGALGASINLVKSLTAVANNTATKIATITVPNVTGGACVGVLALGVLGDGDSADSSYWTIAVSRIAGANALIAVSSAAGAAQVTGATAGATVTISAGSVSGGVTATNTFDIKVTVARSTGSADNHVAVCQFTALNGVASGITVA